MQDNYLVVDGLTKRYSGFVLNGVSFSIPQGAVVGLIGENGAGKSTTIKAILGLITKDSGSVTMLGKRDNEIDNSVCDQIGVVFDGSSFPEGLSPQKLNKAFRNIYPSWNQGKYYSLLEKLSLPVNKKLKEFSKGMKMKLATAVALSHHSKLLILDEATTGLDPIVRDDILDMFLEFVQKGNSILVSSHITSDLEKVADYIVFIHQGKVVFVKSKDELKQQYGIIRCGFEQFKTLDQQDITVSRKQGDVWEVLLSDRNLAQEKYPDLAISTATIDEIMLLYIKGA